MKKILLTNDDGFNCAGYFPLLDKLSKKYDVTAIAPKVQKSWVGKSISAHHDVGYELINHEGHDVYAIEGTPADCVQIGIYNILENKPDYVVSGINDGENIGHGRILSSGTIGAAMEGAIDGVVSISASLCMTKGRNIDYFDRKNYHVFDNAAEIVVRVIEILEIITFDQSIDIISINIPFEATKDTEIVVTVPYKDAYGQLFHKDGNVFRHCGAPVKFENITEGTDLKALYEGKISVTPLDLSLASMSVASDLNKQISSLW